MMFNIFHAFDSESGKKSVLAGRLLFAAIAFIAVIIFIIAKAKLSLILTEAVFLGAVSVYWWFRYPRLAENKIRQRILQMKKEGKLPYRESSELVFLDDCVRETWENGSEQCAYPDFARFEINGQCMYLYLDALRAWILPYSCLEGKEKELIAFLHKKRPDLI